MRRGRPPDIRRHLPRCPGPHDGGRTRARHAQQPDPGPGARIDTAAAFLCWTGRHGLLLEQVTQDHVDRWLTEGASTRYELRDFLAWTNRHGRSRGLDVPVRMKKPVAPLDENSHWELLQQCLHDDELPTAVRVAGAVVLLFGQRLTRIAALTTDHLVEAPEPRLILDRVPIRVPRVLGVLLNTLANTDERTSWPLPPTGPRRLFPGTPANTAQRGRCAATSRLTASRCCPPEPPLWSTSPRTFRQPYLPTCSACTLSPPTAGASGPPPTGPPTCRPAAARRPLAVAGPDHGLGSCAVRWKNVVEHVSNSRTR